MGRMPSRATFHNVRDKWPLPLSRLMEDGRLAAALRRVRVRAGLRQVDVARRAGISQTSVSEHERGHLGRTSLDTLRRHAAALDIRLDLVPRWRGPDLDRLLNAAHSQLHESLARFFVGLSGWTHVPEVSFSIYGERGVIDILAFHAATKTVLVIELKTDIVDVQELIGTLDRKARLAWVIARERGWAVSRVAVWVVVAESHTNRRRVAEHRAVLHSAFPKDGRSVAGWLRSPREPLAALSFWPNNAGGTARTSRVTVRRVRRPSSDRTGPPPRTKPGRSGTTGALPPVGI